jgi:hypothetical protein
MHGEYVRYSSESVRVRERERDASEIVEVRERETKREMRVRELKS